MENFKYIKYAFFAVFILVEYISLNYQKKSYPFLETFSAMTSLCLRKCMEYVLIFLGYSEINYVLTKYKIFNFKVHGMIQILLLMVLIDFIYYWSHRFKHTIRFFWTIHSVHHLPSRLTLIIAHQSSLFDRIATIFSFLIIPAVLIGFKPNEIYQLIIITAIYQALLHNEFIGKLGFLEHILITPTQHRIHHSVLPEHANKNFGGILCIFDKIFGTYHVDQTFPKTYGVVPAFKITNIFSPVVFEWHQWKKLFIDLIQAPGFKNKISVLIKV